MRVAHQVPQESGPPVVKRVAGRHGIVIRFIVHHWIFLSGTILAQTPYLFPQPHVAGGVKIAREVGNLPAIYWVRP
jgi:hypothetical protein